MSYSLVLPASSSAVVIVSATPPASTSEGQKWFNSTTGKELVYYDGFWVEQSNATVLPSTPVVEVTDASYTLSDTHMTGYLRFTATGAKTMYIPATSESFAPIVGDSVMVRNASASGYLTMSPVSLSGVVLNYFSGDNVLGPNETCVWIFVGNNTWDLL